jgi:hypothetical protein
VAMPYSDPKNTNAPKFAPVTWRAIYPTGAQGTYFANCLRTCWTANAAKFNIGQKVGDIPIYPQPIQMSAPQLSAIEAIIQQARQEAGSITVTDSTTGSRYSYTGTPATIYKYPVKMRVYFAVDHAHLAASRTYCESGQWLGENTCTLNLTNLVTARIRYYDFNNHLVISNPPQPR